MKYIIITLDDAKEIVQYLPEGRIKSRFGQETGADIEEIVDFLKNMDICPACELEMQQHSCSSIHSKKIGRRIQRLLDRAEQDYE